jgi:hypothetical protein
VMVGPPPRTPRRSIRCSTRLASTSSISARSAAATC